MMAAAAARAVLSGGPHFRPPVSVGATVPTVLGGLEEDLYQDAELRRQRQQRREHEALAQQVQDAKPRISRNSRAMCQDRLGRELAAAFVQCGATQEDKEAQVVPRNRLPLVLEALGLLNGAEEEEPFCTNLALLLDKENNGTVSSRRLLSFLLRALDRDSQAHVFPQAPSTTAEECFGHLEQRLSRSLSRLLPNRLSRPRLTCRSTSGAESARSFSPGRARTPDPTRVACSATASVGCGGTTPRRPDSARRTRSEAGRASDEQVATSRCHLLYHQAVFASRETAQLEEEIKLLKQREELRECTFRPKLLPPSRGVSPKPQPRNFDTAVARMRAANRRREEHQEEIQHIPAGENYERLRRLGAQPFACYYKDRSVPRRPPLVYVDVNVSRGRTGRIGVHEGDNIRELARNFGKAFQLDRDMQLRLEGLLHQAYNEQVRLLLGMEDCAEPIAEGPDELLPGPFLHH